MSLAERYELGERIGGGGEARVFRARERASGREVAVRLQPGVEPGPLLQPPEPYHGGWVRAYETGRDEKLGLYTVFELLRGDTLAATVARAPLEPEAGRQFARQAFEAVDALHGAGWIHGDLNADNFLLHQGTQWKLLDLPFHRLGRRKASAAAFGSIYTLAPEQIDGATPDARSDLFSLGCLCYFAACGACPHPGRTEAEIAISRLRFPADELGGLAPRYPASYAAWVMRLLARRPEDRPGSVSAAYQLLISFDPPNPTVP